MDLPQNPGNYVATQGQIDAQGRVILVIQNRSAAPLVGVQVTPVLVDAAGRIAQQGNPVVFRSVVQPGQQAAQQTGIGGLAQEQLQYLRFRVDGAKVAE
jgi:hypothetical protein